MTRSISKKNSLYMQLVKLLVGAMFIAVVFFGAINYIGEYMIDNFQFSTTYMEKHDKVYIEKLQQYIQKEHVKSHDVKKLNAWVKEQKVIAIRIYKDHKKVFDSSYPEEEDWDIEIGEHNWEAYYSIQFQDGKAKVNIFGAYAYKLYNYVIIVELLLAMGLFVLLVILGIRKKMNYIGILSDEIEILEGGSLDYQITVQGKDELATLAQGLDNMRLSFRKLIEEEAKMIHENQKIVTQMSHDLRTPITSIMLYTEILKKESHKDKDKLMAYLEKIDKKAKRMKQLTDNLFEYSLVTGEDEIQLNEPETYRTLFYDLFSETCGYLEQKGIKVENHISWTEDLLQVYNDYLIRIMDNITSNILKYADAKKKIEIYSLCEENMIGFTFKNAKSGQEEKVESTCVGIQSIRSMMIKMGGTCEVHEDQEKFSISILFPIYPQMK